jgi:hypothetical protein
MNVLYIFLFMASSLFAQTHTGGDVTSSELPGLSNHKDPQVRHGEYLKLLGRVDLLLEEIQKTLRNCDRDLSVKSFIEVIQYLLIKDFSHILDTNPIGCEYSPKISEESKCQLSKNFYVLLRQIVSSPYLSDFLNEFGNINQEDAEKWEKVLQEKFP